MTTDITELAQREKFEAWWEREYKHLESSKYTDAVPHIKYGFWMAYQAGGAELVEELEKAQGMEAYWKTQCRGITDHCEGLQARIAELESHTVKPPVHPTVASENLDDETLQELIEFRRTTFEYHSKEGNKVQTIIHGVTLAALRELQERRKADSEPVAEVVSIYGDHEAFGEREIRPLVGIQQMPYGTKLYRHAQPAPDREQVRREHAEWSQTTFGNVGPVGPLKHLSKEALEAAAEPGDLSEWADMQFLMWDAQRRAGITDEQITQAMIEKLAVNKLREWPEPKDGEPRLHIKEQPAPAFPDFDNVLESLDYEVRCNAWESEHVLKACQATYDACRAAMLQELQKSAGAEATCRSNKNVQDLQVDNSPAIPDGYVMVPVEPNGDMLAAAQDAYGETDGDIASTLRAAMLAAAPQEVK